MWYVSQIGRREHYALPAHLHRIGQLGLFATDIWAPWTARPNALIRSEKLAQRYEASMAGAQVAHQSFITNLLAHFRGGDTYRRWTLEGTSFGKFAADRFRKAGIGSGDSVIGYTAANLEQLILARRLGAKAFHVQVDPGLAWYETRLQEQLAHPSSERLSPMPNMDFIERIRHEWEEAGKVIVHSEHSRAALVAQGVPVSRCVVIPPAFSSTSMPAPRRLDLSRPLRVLFVGNHCLAKGYHVFVEAARLTGADFEFISVGGHSMSSSYLAAASEFISILGPMSQAGVRNQMERADLLVFPTLSDGFGLVQLEAMAAGLPVFATPCCGEVVRHGINGVIIPPRNASAIVTALEELRGNPDKYELLAAAAAQRPLDYRPELHFRALLSL